MGRPKIPYCNEFSAQKQNARRRNIPFEFTYNTWIEWWGDDITKRGRGKDKLVMARLNDTGPYHPTNVKKMLNQDNVVEGNLGKIVADSTKEKLSHISYMRWKKEKEKENI